MISEGQLAQWAADPSYHCVVQTLIAEVRRLTRERDALREVAKLARPLLGSLVQSRYRSGYLVTVDTADLMALQSALAKLDEVKP
jgi:hypothetical protein